MRRARWGRSAAWAEWIVALSPARENPPTTAGRDNLVENWVARGGLSPITGTGSALETRRPRPAPQGRAAASARRFAGADRTACWLGPSAPGTDTPASDRAGGASVAAADKTFPRQRACGALPPWLSGPHPSEDRPAVAPEAAP